MTIQAPDVEPQVIIDDDAPQEVRNAVGVLTKKPAVSMQVLRQKGDLLSPDQLIAAVKLSMDYEETDHLSALRAAGYILERHRDGHLDFDEATEKHMNKQIEQDRDSIELSAARTARLEIFLGRLAAWQKNKKLTNNTTSTSQLAA